jgi:GTP cyclohydrolase II
MSKKGGIILYLRQEGRGIGLFNKLKAYQLQDHGLNTFEANIELGFKNDCRDFNIAARMLEALEKKEIYLLSNNHDKKFQLIENGINVIDIIPTKVYLNVHNRKYLEAKKNEANHDINI